MQTIEWNQIDKSSWGDGPWQREPDKRQWLTAAGLPGLIVRNRLGALCGYVGVPETHKFYGKDYDHSATRKLRVHGSLTFANKCSPDHSGICHVPEAGEPDSVWWLGFDCAHLDDVVPKVASELRGHYCDGEVYRDLAYVTAEVEQLAEQIARKRPRSS